MNPPFARMGATDMSCTADLKHQRDEYQKAYCDQKREVEKVKEDRSTLTELLEDERKSLKEEIECTFRPTVMPRTD